MPPPRCCHLSSLGLRRELTRKSKEGAQFACSQTVFSEDDPQWQNSLDIKIPNFSISVGPGGGGARRRQGEMWWCATRDGYNRWSSDARSVARELLFRACLLASKTTNATVVHKRHSRRCVVCGEAAVSCVVKTKKGR